MLLTVVTLTQHSINADLNNLKSTIYLMQYRVLKSKPLDV